jgi:hypothetical protein
MGSGLSNTTQEVKLQSERVVDPETAVNLKATWRRGSLRRCSALDGIDINAEQEADTIALAKVYKTIRKVCSQSLILILILCPGCQLDLHPAPRLQYQVQERTCASFSVGGFLCFVSHIESAIVTPHFSVPLQPPEVRCLQDHRQGCACR